MPHAQKYAELKQKTPDADFEKPQEKMVIQQADGICQQMGIPVGQEGQGGAQGQQQQ